jgi:hypothetical protein
MAAVVVAVVVAMVSMQLLCFNMEKLHILSGHQSDIEVI